MSFNQFDFSPRLPQAKYECSPIVGIDKFPLFNQRCLLNNEGVTSAVRNINILEKFGSQMTPEFKTPYDTKGVNPSNKIVIPLNNSNSENDNCEIRRSQLST